MNNSIKKKFFSFFMPFIMIIFIPVYTVYASHKTVIPSGSAAGVKMYTDGLLVIGISDVTGDDGKKYNVCGNSGIKVNDSIKRVNDTAVESSAQLSEAVNNNHDGFRLTIERDGSESSVYLKPVKTEDGTYKIGLWVRDSTAGIGTVTYIDPENHTFAALGHGICDVDTGQLLTIRSGNILNCPILSVVKGKRGSPGELNGSFDGPIFGTISVNTENGLYGYYDKNTFSYDPSATVPVASRFEAEEGEAHILCDISGSGAKQYSIKITRLSKRQSKGIVFEVTDEDLIDRTGGIIQGMSGAPIIQNDMLIGAVTHVMINDPKKGYGIFAENMIDISDKL